jgi:hypothetical protein
MALADKKAYPQRRQLDAGGRFTMISPDGLPHVVSRNSGCKADEDAIDVGAFAIAGSE